MRKASDCIPLNALFSFRSWVMLESIVCSILYFIRSIHRAPAAGWIDGLPWFFLHDVILIFGGVDTGFLCCWSYTFFISSLLNAFPKASTFLEYSQGGLVKGVQRCKWKGVPFMMIASSTLSGSAYFRHHPDILAPLLLFLIRRWYQTWCFSVNSYAKLACCPGSQEESPKKSSNSENSTLHSSMKIYIHHDEAHVTRKIMSNTISR